VPAVEFIIKTAEFPIIHDEPLWPGFNGPTGVYAVEDPIGPENDRYILRAVQETGKVIAAGVHSAVLRTAAVHRKVESHVSNEEL